MDSLLWFGFLSCFLDGAICVVGECEFLQCAVPGKHGAVSDGATLRGRDVTFFLLKPIFTHVSRYAPGSPKPGVSKPTPTRPPALVSYVRLRTPANTAEIQLGQVPAKYTQISPNIAKCMTWQCLRAHVLASSIAYLKLGSASTLPFAHVFGGRGRRRRGLASTGRAVSLAAALVVSSAPLALGPPRRRRTGGARRV